MARQNWIVWTKDSPSRHGYCPKPLHIPASSWFDYMTLWVWSGHRCLNNCFQGFKVDLVAVVAVKKHLESLDKLLRYISVDSRDLQKPLPVILGGHLGLSFRHVWYAAKAARNPSPASPWFVSLRTFPSLCRSRRHAKETEVSSGFDCEWSLLFAVVRSIRAGHVCLDLWVDQVPFQLLISTLSPSFFKQCHEL